MRKLFWLLSLFLGVFLFTVSVGRAEPLFPYIVSGQVKPGTHAPKITHSFAVEKGYHGYILKIYIEAEDPDGDMALIGTEISRPGVGYYPTSWTVVKPQYQKQFRGYIQLNTFDFTKQPREGAYITLKVSVIDRTLNESNVVVFPFTFETGIGDPYKYTLAAPFAKEDPRLGHIFVFPSGVTGGRSR